MPARLNLASAKITRYTDDGLDGDPLYSQAQIVISSQDPSKARIRVDGRTEWISGVQAVEADGRDRWRLVTTDGTFEVVRDARRCCGARR